MFKFDIRLKSFTTIFVYLDCRKNIEPSIDYTNIHAPTTGEK